MSKPKNKLFKVVWEVHLERSYIEELMPPDGDESTVQDLVSIISIDKMQAGATDRQQWLDENNEPITRLWGHLSDGVIAGETEPVEYDMSLSWEEEFLKQQSEENK